ncbi:hypothetical protein A0256_17020 [Mucilaginibacter sp. PAMC 26640]|nr:hypothetical protein A0256_17020 [Mucilaginibacter sp. PAMC 26640]
MKKIFVTIAIAASLFTTNIYAATSAPKIEDGTENVTYAAITKFNSDFARAQNASWKVSSNFQKVSFTLDDVKMSAFYNLRGELIGVTQNVQFNALPEKARKEIGTKYEGYFAKEVIKLETGDDNSFDNTVYFVDLKKDNDEFLVRVTPSAGVYFFQTVK